jgi:MFS family permease
MDERTRAIDRADLYEDDAWGPDAAYQDPEPTARRGARFSPVAIGLAIALVAAVLFLGFALTVRDDTQVPLLAAGFAFLGIVLVALAVLAARATYRLAVERRNGPAFGTAIGGGLAAMIGLGCLAGALVFLLLWHRP